MNLSNHKINNCYMRSCVCGSDEFVTQPNRYDVYRIVDGRLEFQRSLLTDDEVAVYCRGCSRRYEEAGGV